jgi:peptidoglycan hydrolase-like protein with peptidoglycan-binding domain
LGNKLTPKPTQKTAEQVAQEISKGQGNWGNNPDRARKLQANGYDARWVQNRVNQILKGQSKSPSKAPAKPKASLAVDGYVGPEVVKALQRYFDLVVDGEIWGQFSGNQATKAFNQRAVKYGKSGSPVVKALQRKIGATADGIWGAGTTRALQRYLGTPVDGIISRPSTAIRELQRRLNNGTF